MPHIKDVELKTRSFFGDFKKFATKGNFLDLAVGIVIGASFSTVTNSLVSNIITPPIGLLIGRVNFTDLAVHLGGTATIQYGLFIQALIQFVITAFALFLIIRLITRLQEVAKKDEPPTAPPALSDPDDVAVLKEIRDLLKQQTPSYVRPLPTAESSEA
jgi:large conductance mechanosensitive channel